MDVKTISNFLTSDECDKMIKISTEKVTHNFTDSGVFTNKKWVDYELSNYFFDKLKATTNRADFLRANNLIMSGAYKPGDSFGIHTDTGLYYDEDTNEKSRWTLLIYLNDDFVGGETIFYHTHDWSEYCRIKPEKGKALIFDIDLWHSGEKIKEGMKYWIGCEIIGKF